jgi:glucose/mannose transport system substrate-binding protein
MRNGFVLLSLLLLGCRSDVLGADDEAGVEDTLEIYSWWTGSGESEALAALLEIYSDRHPRVAVSNAAARDPMNARTELANRLARGEPPDTFQAISGTDLLTYVHDDKMTAIGYLAERNGYRDVFPAVVLETLKADDEPYAVPLNIERDNNLYYNVALLEEHGIIPPDTLQGFYEMCATLRAADPPVEPLAMPPEGWVLALVVFETLMPGLNGGSFYLKFFNGKAQLAEGSPDRVELERLFTEFFRVAQCSNVDKGTATDQNYRGWDLHGDKLYDGEAATIVMGDWMKGYLEGGSNFEGDLREQWTANVDFGVVSGFGSGDYFTFNSAVFGLPSGAPHPKAAEAFLEIAASKEGQAAFNPLKGSVPARTDVDLDAFDDMVRKASQDFQSAAAGEDMLLPGYASLTTFDFQVAINPALVVFTLGGAKAKAILNEPRNSVVSPAEEGVLAGDVDYIVQKITANYARINL